MQRDEALFAGWARFDRFCFFCNLMHWRFYESIFAIVIFLTIEKQNDFLHE